MEKFTKTEIQWVINLLENSAAELRLQMNKTEEFHVGVDTELMKLRIYQYLDISARLKRALNNGNKRIEIQ